jgi:cyclic pyranopterin phosphate synthase
MRTSAKKITRLLQFEHTGISAFIKREMQLSPSAWEDLLSKDLSDNNKLTSRVPVMVDISSKPQVRREATATGTILLKGSTMKLINDGRIEKGDPVQIASVAAIQAVKETPRNLMMCHPIPIESSSVEFEKSQDSISVTVNVVAFSKTGVEMEALNGVSAALLNIWDVVKKYEKTSDGQYPDTRIREIRVLRKLKGQ